jgi:uncharacterized protein (DUF1810 family)
MRPMRVPALATRATASVPRAQAHTHDQALAELERGHKPKHWMWFIFPQIAGLGRSAMAQHYALRSRAEAAAYLVHPVLGSRLKECTAAVLRHPDKDVVSIFGDVDAMKFQSSMTLFDAVAGPSETSFGEALTTFYGGERDQRSLELLA